MSLEGFWGEPIGHVWMLSSAPASQLIQAYTTVHLGTKVSFSV